MKKVFQTFLWNTLSVIPGRLVMLLGRLRALPKRGGVLGRQMFSMRLWRKRLRISLMEEARRFQVLFAQQVEKSKNKPLGFFVCKKRRLMKRDSVLLDRKGNSSDRGVGVSYEKGKKEELFKKRFFQFLNLFPPNTVDWRSCIF